MIAHSSTRLSSPAREALVQQLDSCPRQRVGNDALDESLLKSICPTLRVKNRIELLAICISRDIAEETGSRSFRGNGSVPARKRRQNERPLPVRPNPSKFMKTRKLGKFSGPKSTIRGPLGRAKLTGSISTQRRERDRLPKELRSGGGAKKKRDETAPSPRGAEREVGRAVLYISARAASAPREAQMR